MTLTVLVWGWDLPWIMLLVAWLGLMALALGGWWLWLAGQPEDEDLDREWKEWRARRDQERLRQHWAEETAWVRQQQAERLTRARGHHDDTGGAS